MSRFDEIPPGARVYQAHNATFWYHDGLVLGKHLPETPHVTLEDAISAFQRISEMTGGKRTPMMFDGRGLGWLHMDARAYIRATAPELFSRVAIVVDHKLIRLLTQALVGAAGLDVPIRLFTDEEKAWEYLGQARPDSGAA